MDGAPGLGKTTAMQRLFTQTTGVYLRAQSGWTYPWFLNTLLEALAEPVPTKVEDRFKAVLNKLDDLAFAAHAQGETFSMIIDECDLISNRPKIMEAIRGISDVKQVPTVLVGMGRLRHDLRRFPQINSRAAHKVQFLPATHEDARALINALCEVPVSPELIKFVWRVSKGFNREILNAIANMEAVGKRLDLDEYGLTLADMAGQKILQDRDTGEAVIVPEVNYAQ
ncbi:ATP-binding protein [uncultured Tateyamaria sp.]|uniref:ATP-binding protein n=1 Tax=uncultured Tateyamaria sp. TaxID=455651 RepID=UPI00262FF793|nr:ATP-binding protein [uncultured Tateyamaria sp.]